MQIGGVTIKMTLNSTQRNIEPYHELHLDDYDYTSSLEYLSALEQSRKITELTVI